MARTDLGRDLHTRRFLQRIIPSRSGRIVTLVRRFGLRIGAIAGVVAAHFTGGFHGPH